jgi:alpha-amylase
MLHISEKVRRARTRHPRSREIARAQDCLWRAQCNCAYWHGVFGGLYLTNLRNALQRNLVEAEAIVEKARHKNPAWIEAESIDLDIDGHEDVLLKTPVQNLLFKPAEGGMLIAHDFKPARLNLTDTLRRREEAYHAKIKEAAVAGVASQGGTASIHDSVLAKEPDLEKHLIVDWHRRASLIDHFLSRESTLEEMRRSAHGEDGDFVNQPYSARWHARAGKGHVALTREGALYQSGGVRPLRIEKTVRTESEATWIEVTHTLTNLGEDEIRTRFGVEFNVNLLAGDAPDRFVYVHGQELEDRRLISVGESAAVECCGLVDEWMGVNISWEFDRPPVLWRFPIETVSLSESGFERVYQSTVIFPHWDDVVIPAGATWENRMKMNVEKFK